MCRKLREKEMMGKRAVLISFWDVGLVRLFAVYNGKQPSTLWYIFFATGLSRGARSSLHFVMALLKEKMDRQ